MHTMAKKKGPTRRLSDPELLGMFDQDLTTLQHLAGVYDRGYAPIAFDMATLVLKILTENSAAMKARSAVRFPSYPIEREELALTATHRLTAARVGGADPKVTFVPLFYNPGGFTQGKAVEFKIWWNREAIYRASAAIPGSPPGMIPINDAPSVPFADRATVSRYQLVHMLRNKRGAHQTEEYPVLLDELDHAANWGHFGVSMPDGSQRSTWEGTLPIDVGPVAAMMRMILHEVLESYGRADPPPPQPTA